MAKALMVQGTGSGAGKSLIAAAFCRIFRDQGMRVAPFKAQNMALNSYITLEGGEIGRAQALQAEAAGVEPTVEMNPVLLKASGEAGAQVILRGKVHSTMKATEYYAFRKKAWDVVTEAYARLADRHDMIVIEGAGSPAEINLMEVDIVNMAMARHAGSPVLLVGDIDKGGVFASLYGTAELLGEDRRLIKGFIINKFRGDIEILRPGLEMIRQKTGIPVIGVLPYMHDMGLPEEDGMALYQNAKYRGRSGSGSVRIVVARLKYLSNFTDFDPFYHEPDVEILYSTNRTDIENADLVIIPGTKNTVKDLMILKELGLDTSIRNAFDKGIMVMGMCGGYQMLGRTILDPHGMESGQRETEGIGLLNISTVFGTEKKTFRVSAEILDSPAGGKPEYSLQGYEIHMGVSSGDIGLFRTEAVNAGKGGAHALDGSRNRHCWGTYLHGIFDNDRFRRDLLNSLRIRRGLNPLDVQCDYAAMRGQAIDRLAGMVREHLDMERIREMLAA